MKVTHTVSTCLLVIFGFFVGVSHAQHKTFSWVEDSFDDFADGTLDASGQNIYVSIDGSIRTIQRFDLNDDGYLDLFFGNTHDHSERVDPTECAVTPDRQITARNLSVPGSNEIDAADLNNDGWTDLVFTLEKSGLQHGRVFLWILYGGDDGWSTRRSTVIPANGPLSTEIADLNDDGWPDIAVLNSADGPVTAEKNIRIYWGADNGFLLSQYQDIGLPGAIALCSADFDGDGVTDLAALNSGAIRLFYGYRTNTDKIHMLRDGKVAGFWGASTKDLDISLNQLDIVLPEVNARCFEVADVNSDGHPDLVAGTNTGLFYILHGGDQRELANIETVNASPASDICAGDLDGDGYDDLIISNLSVTGRASTAGGEMGSVDASKLSPVRIYWGRQTGVDWVTPTELKADFATATAIGDLDGDDKTDIAVAIFQEATDKTFDSRSLIYFGQGDRTFELSPDHVPTAGATDVVVVSPENNQRGRAVFANRLAGTLYERVPVYVYWGQPDGFDPNNRWVIPGQSGHEATGADLNADGYVDLVMTLTAHGGPPALQNPIIGTNILWGGPDGYDLKSRRTVLREPYMDTSTAADLNRDGYLDLVLGGWEQWYSEETDKEAYIAISYGSAEGFEPKNKVELRSEGRSNGVNVADFNKDGWLDISATSRLKSRVRIFWGGAGGFDENRQQWLTVPIAMGTEIADFNSDGWLDLVVSSYRDYVNVYNDTGNSIFWGGPEGFRHWDMQWLPGSCAHYQAVADFDNDGFLDLFVPNYHGQYRRGDLPSYLFWGGPDGFDIRRKTNLICNSACGAQTGDFNSDGLIDLAVACHSKFGTHQVDSKVFYNDGDRFARPEVTNLPTLGAHMMWIQDMGHIYDRKPIQRYESSVFEWQSPAEHATLRYDADIPEGARLEFSVRSAANNKALSNASWHPLKTNRIALRKSDRSIQYRATFTSDNGDRFPALHRIIVEFD
jgi:hypothetical protein